MYIVLNKTGIHQVNKHSSELCAIQILSFVNQQDIASKIPLSTFQINAAHTDTLYVCAAFV